MPPSGFPRLENKQVNCYKKVSAILTKGIGCLEVFAKIYYSFE